MTDATRTTDAQACRGNDFLDPLLARERDRPGSLFCTLYQDGQWNPVDFGTFMARARRFAGLVLEHGLTQGEVVPLVLRHDLDAHAAFVGVMLAGGVPSYLPYPNVKQDHALYWRQHTTLFAHVRPRLVLTYDDLVPQMEEAVAAVGATVLGQSRADGSAPLDCPVPTANADTALLQHSSGTTGLKKGVALSYGAVCRHLSCYRQALELDAVDAPVVASWLPLYHDMGLITSFLMPLWLGLPLVSMDPFDWTARPALLLEAVERFRATHAWLPNFAFVHLSRVVPRGARHDLSSLRALVSCSEPCKPAAFEMFQSRFRDWGLAPAALQTCYAMAETVFAVSQNSLSAPPRVLDVDRASIEAFGPVRLAGPDQGENAVRLLSNGPPVPGCRVGVWRDGAMQGEDQVGEIAVRTDSMFSGYYRNEEASAKSRAGEWFLTGDVGFVHDGEVYIVGRIKDVIIVNGKNVFSHDVEAALLGVEGIKPGRAVAFGLYSERTGSEQLVVVAERPEAPSADQERHEAAPGADQQRPATDIAADIIRRVFEAVGVPCADVRVVEPGWLVKTTSGKISRAENLKKYEAMFRTRPSQPRAEQAG